MTAGLFILKLSTSLPFNTLKIDRSFVNRMGVDGESLEIVPHHHTAHSLNMNVTAEGGNRSTTEPT